MPECSYSGCSLPSPANDPDGCGRCILHCPRPDKEHAAFTSALGERANQRDYGGCVFPTGFHLSPSLTSPPPQSVGFEACIFHQNAQVYFAGSLSNFSADFQGAKFCQGAWVSFANCQFSQASLNFDGAFLHEGAELDFSGAKFYEGSSLDLPIQGKINFRMATFKITLVFNECNFLDGSSFTGVEGMEHVTFRRCDLSQVSFLESPRLEESEFDDVEWTHPPQKKGLERLWIWLTGESQRAVCRDELKANAVPQPPLYLYASYEKAARVCNQLRRSYESRRRFLEAGDFYYGEMEMRRLADGGKIRRNLLSTLGWYFHLSGYGQSWRKALVWFMVLVVAFSIAQGLAGVQVERAGATITVEKGWRGLSAFGTALGESLLYSFRSATLLRDPAYAPTNLLGHFGLALENVLGPLILGLMGLAIRRKFRH